jgi:hypothetical protein
MKNNVTRMLGIGIALVAAAAVQAQDRTVTAAVPFSFYAGPSLMPQGSYRVGEIANSTILWLSAKQKDSTKAVTTHAIAGNKLIEPARLTFHCYGETCFLAEVWSGDSSVGRALSRSSREKELAQNGPAATLAVIRLSLHQ